MDERLARWRKFRAKGTGACQAWSDGYGCCTHDPAMRNAFRAIAVDYDGTLTTRQRPSNDVLLALSEVRAAGLKVVLVTGRMMPELWGDFPDVGQHVDLIVAENGGVLWCEEVGTRAVVPPVPSQLEAALLSRGVRLRRGEVLLATEACFDGIALEEIGRLGLDCQLVRNREALMILPAGVSKGTGLCEALGELGISPHCAIGIGDAENDHSLLEACEIGVAVANAIPSLKLHADVVLTEPNGVGIAGYLRGVLGNAFPLPLPNRWRVVIGTRADGSEATLPGSGINMLIAGGSGSGKSYLAGLFAERVVKLGYSVCVLDPEGDHTNLGDLRGMLTLGGKEGVPSPAQVARVLRQSGGAIVDLSLMRQEERTAYTATLLGHLAELRRSTGVPHWIFLDEAHASLCATADAARAFEPSHKGFCLVTYRPTELCEKALAEVDVMLLLPHSVAVAHELLRRHGEAGEKLVPLASEIHQGQALLITTRGGLHAEVVTLGKRISPHVRHWHKYVHGYLPPRHHFHFCDDRGRTGRHAANLEDFHLELLLAPAAVLTHHAQRGDFSRWISQVLQDSALSADIRALETSGTSGDVEALRSKLVDALEKRYGDTADGTDGVPQPAVSWRYSSAARGLLGVPP